MGEKTKISWTDHTFNVAWGCTKVSPGCERCYAWAFSKRLGLDIWGRGNERRTFGGKHWREPISWNRAAERDGVRRRVFCCSMCDVFEDHPAIDAERAKLWPLIRQTPHLDWLLLTKRPERIAACLPPDWGTGYRNGWLGTSVESDPYSDRVNSLVRVPAVVHFVSAEPLLGPLRSLDVSRVTWLIAGGESGSGFRPMDLDWARDLRDRCLATGTAFFFKQGSHQYPGRDTMLDGREWHEWPSVPQTPEICHL
ncbi:MAG: DUF5131 family protein [Planctomycetes bacterium]|nr:DUF5131 family protein [Planctomycetota bacterium]